VFTLEQFIIAVVVSMLLSIVSMALNKRISQKRKDMALAVIKGPVVQLITTLTDQPLKMGLTRVVMLLNKYKESIAFTMHECPDYNMVIFKLKPVKAPTDVDGIIACVVYDSKDGNYLITGNIFITLMTEENANTVVSRAYQSLMKEQDYDEITHIVRGESGKGFVASVNGFNLSIGVIKNKDKAASVSLMVKKHCAIPANAVHFVFHGGILNL